MVIIDVVDVDRVREAFDCLGDAAIPSTIIDGTIEVVHPRGIWL
jgi:hypothetical protein